MSALRPAALQTGPPAVRLSPAAAPAASSAAPALSPAVRELVSAPGAGSQLAEATRTALETSLEVPLDLIRVHADARTAAVVDNLGARAFTYGLHIFLGSGAQATDLGLMAHEVAHVVQQQGQPVLQMNSEAATGDAFEQEAHNVSGAVRRGEHVSVHGRTGGSRLQGIWPLDQIGNWLENRAWDLLNHYAPDLVPIIRQGPLEWIKERLSAAVENMLDFVMRPVRAITGIGTALMAHFTNLLTWLRTAAAQIARGDCSSLAEAAQKIQQVFESLTAPAIERLQAMARSVREFFSGLWERFGAPVWQLLQRIGGAVWERIQQFGRWVWDLTAPIRRVLNRAWTWIKNRLGIGEGEEGQNGILQWLQRKARDVWDRYLLPFITRFRTPLMVVGGILLMLSPAGPLIALGAIVGGVIIGVGYIRRAFGTVRGVVNQRDLLQRTIIPGILNTVNRVSTFLMDKARFVADRLTGIVSGLSQAAGAVAGTILRFAVGALQWLIDRFRELVNWAVEKLIGLATWVTQTLERLRVWLQPVLDFLRRVAAVVRNVLSLAYEFGARIWNAIPACIRDPFIDFFIPLILRQIAFFRELGASPEAWQETRAQIMLLIRQVFRDFDLMGAIRTAFRIVVRALRIPLDLMQQLLTKAAQAWDAVLAAPMRFIVNALRAILQGLGRFMRNILSHLWFGIQGWLFNAVSTSGISISPPSSWTNLREVFVFVMNVLGLSIDHIIELIDRRVPGAGRPLRRAVRILSGVLEWLQIAIDQGPRGLWNHLVDRLGNLGTMVLESAVGWIMTRVIANVSARLTAMAASAGLTSVLEAVKAIYSAIQTAIEYMPRILAIIIRVFDTVIQIAAGETGPAAEMLEGGLRLAMPVAIGFLANYAGLGGIGGRIVEIIHDVRERIDNAILGLIDRAIAAIRAILDRIRAGVAAVLEWWRQRKDFTSEAGEHHAVYLDRSGGNVRIMISSYPETYREFINNISVPTNKQSAKADALRIAGQLDQAIQRASRSTGGASGSAAGTVAADPSVEITNLLNQLATSTASFIPRSDNASSEFVFGPLVTGFGSSVRVARLTKNHPDGSGPSAEGGYWDALRTRMDGGSTYYVRGHLLNDNLGGPGNDWRNLSPLTQATNNRSALSMLHTFENSVKTAVNGGAAVEFIVTMSYGRGSRNADVAAARRIEPEEEGETIAEIILAERNVPTSVHGEAYRLPASGARTSLESSTVANSIDTNLDHYYITATPRRTILLNSATPAQLRELNGVNAAKATEIIARRPFGDRDDAIAKLGGETWHAIVSTAGMRIRF
jgi:hypothetical protein